MFTHAKVKNNRDSFYGYENNSKQCSGNKGHARIWKLRKHV